MPESAVTAENRTRGQGWSTLSGVSTAVERYWDNRREALMARLDEAIGRLQEMAVLEDKLRHGYADEKSFTASLGGFAASALDPASLFRLVGREQARTGRGAERLKRLRALVDELEELRARMAKSPPVCRFMEPGTGVDEALEQLEAHLAENSAAVRLLRMTRLEERGQYLPHLHDDLFASFSWRDFEPGDMALVPPLVVLGDAMEQGPAAVGNVLRLVSSGLPVKLVLPRGSFAHPQAGAGDNTLPPLNPEFEAVLLSLRRVFIIQAPVIEGQELELALGAGLAGPGPCVISVLAESYPARSGDQRVQDALRSRAFPVLVYDPLHRREVGRGLDLSANPDLESEWPRQTVQYQTSDGEAESLEQEYTFADFALGEEEFSEHFRPVPESAHRDMLPLAEYLRLSPHNRRGKTPFVAGRSSNGTLEHLIPSTLLVALTEERRETWLSLKEMGALLGGRILQAPRPEITAEPPRAAISGNERRAIEKAAVAESMRKLVLKLSEMGAGGVDLSRVLAQATAPGASGAGPDVPVEQGVKIDTEECTACDECVIINPKIFAYNDQKKAYVKDPLGGPFRDIVKAAEKCTADIIHPGKPLNPREPELDKWLKRAQALGQ